MAVQEIALENLMIDLANPRNDSQNDQRHALAAIAHEQGIKLVNLAEDIAERGLNPSDLPIVVEAEEKGIYTVLEGNRRIAALKLCTSLELLNSIELPKKFEKRLIKIHEDRLDYLPSLIVCNIVQSRDDAEHWINLKHTGENDGIGIVNWDGVARQRFRGTSPALTVVDLVRDSDWIDETTREKLAKISITNITRLLNTPEVRHELGVNVEKNELTIVGDRDVVIGRLAIIVSEIANKEIKVTDLDTKEQRIEYARQVNQRPLPTPIGNSDPNHKTATVTSTSKNAGKSPRNVSPKRKTLMPGKYKVEIQHTRINQIYHELRRLDVEKYPNSCAVMLRVFIELSLEEYAQKKNIVLTIPQKSSKPKKPFEKSICCLKSY